MERTVTYQDLHQHCHQLAERLGSFKPGLVVGLSRGGLVPGVILSHLYNVPLMPISWSTRDHLSRDWGGVSSIAWKIPHTPVLIVDDICDSGKTFESLFAQLGYRNGHENLKFASLYYKKSSTFTPDVYGEIVSDHTWIIFPYETRTDA